MHFMETSIDFVSTKLRSVCVPNNNLVWPKSAQHSESEPQTCIPALNTEELVCVSKSVERTIFEAVTIWLV